MKVYLVVLEWSDYDGVEFDTRVASTMEKAKEIFEEFKKDHLVAYVLENCEFCKDFNNSIYAYNSNNVINLYIVEKAVE